jgi:hypothetical protein
MADISRDQQTLNAAAVAIMLSNEELRNQTEQVFAMCLRHIKHIMAFGSSADKLAISRTVINIMLKGLGAVQNAEADQGMADAYSRLRTEMATALVPVELSRTVTDN